MGQARQRGTPEERRQAALARPGAAGLFGGVADRSPTGLKLLAALRAQVPGTASHVDAFLQSGDGFMAFAMDERTLAMEGALLSRATTYEELVSKVLPSIFFDQVRGPGTFVVAVEGSRSARIETLVEQLRSGPAAQELRVGIPAGHLGIVISAASLPLMVSSVEVGTLAATLDALEEVAGLSPADRTDPAVHARLQSEAAGLLSGPASSQEGAQSGAATLALWCALNQPLPGRGAQEALAGFLAASPLGQAWINVSADAAGRWGYSVSDRPMDMLGMQARLTVTPKRAHAAAAAVHGQC